MLTAILIILAQQQVPSVTIPPTTEQTIVFSDRGRTYFVGITSGRVTYLDGNEPAPPDIDNSGNLGVKSREFYRLIKSKVSDPQKRAFGANAMIASIDATVAQAGAISLDLSQLVDLLAQYTSANKLPDHWAGVAFGDYLKSRNCTTSAEFVAVLGEVRAACVELAK